MQENGRTPNDGFNPIGICHRLFTFIMNSFLIRATKRVTLGTPTDVGPSRSRAEGHVIRPEGHVIGPDGRDSNPEMLVEFRHTNGGSVKQRSKTSGSDSDRVSVRENATKTRRGKDSRDQGDENGSGRGENVNKKKSDLVILNGENLPGRRHHLLSVASNINEKADDFIRSRKEAMEKI